MAQPQERTLWDAVEQDETLPHALASSIRSAYFATAGPAALRYRVSLSDVISHLLRAGICRSSRPERAVANMRCVVLTTALVRGDAQAWTDLSNDLSSSFDRACAARLDSVQGIAFARRFWAELRACAGGMPRAAGARAPDLRAYAGLRPLRYWLAERMFGSLEQELGREVRNSYGTHAAPRLDRVRPARTLRLPSQVITAEAKAR